MDGVLILYQDFPAKPWYTIPSHGQTRGSDQTVVDVPHFLVPTKTVMSEVFSRFSSGPDDYRFAKTQIPIKLAAFNDEPLTSRSSAKRVLSRIDRTTASGLTKMMEERFDEVILDFAGVRSIGQAFADEIFRVFATAHPKIDLVPVNASIEVTQMIRRAQAAARDSEAKE